MYFYRVFLYGVKYLSNFEQLLDVQIIPFLTYSIMKARSNFIKTQN